MIDKNGKIRLKKSRSVEHLEVGAASHDQAKTRLNVTVLPSTSTWLKGRGNASQTIDELVAEAMNGNLTSPEQSSQQLAELTRKNEELSLEITRLQTQLQQEAEKRPNYQAIRNQVLSNLKLGRQATQYKQAVKVLDLFIAKMQ